MGYYIVYMHYTTCTKLLVQANAQVLMSVKGVKKDIHMDFPFTVVIDILMDICMDV